MLSGDEITVCLDELAATHGWVRLEREVRHDDEILIKVFWQIASLEPLNKGLGISEGHRISEFVDTTISPRPWISIEPTNF